MTDTLSEPLANITQCTSNVTVQTWLMKALTSLLNILQLRFFLMFKTTAPQGGFTVM